MVGFVAKERTSYACDGCGQRLARWAGRCPHCGGWGTVQAAVRAATGSAVAPEALGSGSEDASERVPSGLAGVDRVLGGGVVPGSVTLLAGEPGIGKSTLLLQLLGSLTSRGAGCLLVSGEESRAQVAGRARRLGVDPGAIRFAAGRDLEQVLDAARTAAPFLLAVDSIQAVRDPAGGQVPGGVAQVRMCTDALVGLAKAEGVAVVLIGHVTKDGDLAGPRALEHAVDAVLTFDGDPRNGLRVLSGGKNRFGPEGETAWFEMAKGGLTEVDPSGVLLTGERVAGAAVALPRSGRRALAVEVQALVGALDGPPRRQATGLDPRRFQLVAAVLDRVVGLPVGRAELFGATCGGARVDDPACDLAIAAALVSACTGIPAPEGAAFVGEVSLTGLIRPVPRLSARAQAARAAGCKFVYAPGMPQDPPAGVRVRQVRNLREALDWALPRPLTSGNRLPA
jgi:DNA repair protein RadA/Sms